MTRPDDAVGREADRRRSQRRGYTVIAWLQPILIVTQLLLIIRNGPAWYTVTALVSGCVVLAVALVELRRLRRLDRAELG